MNVEEYIKGKQAAGHSVHCHQNVWWETIHPGYCKPAIPFQRVELDAKPERLRSAIGFCHATPSSAGANGAWDLMVLHRPALANFSIESVAAKKRSQVRKGIQLNEVRLLARLDDYRGDLTAVCISTAVRNGRGYPASYYEERNDQWWASLTKAARYTEFWGAIFDGRVIAYLAAQVAGDLAIIDAEKSLTEQLGACPNDALVFRFLESCRDRETVREIIYGGWSVDKMSLNRFKASFGFEREQMPFRRRLLFGCIQLPPRQRGPEQTHGA